MRTKKRGEGGTALEPRIIVSEKKLTILLAKDGSQYCAYCPELDLVAELGSPQAAIDDLIEAIKEYAEEYLQDFALYSKSPNRAHHLPYIEAVKACKDDWELRTLLEIRYGNLHI